MSELAQSSPIPMSLSGIPTENTVQPVSAMVKPFKEINAMDEQSKKYKLAEEFDIVNKQAQDREDMEILQTALKEGADMQTPEGTAKLAKDLKGKVSPKAYAKLVQMHSEMKDMENLVSKNLAAMDSAKLEQAAKQSEFVVRNLSGLMDEYDANVKEKGLAAAVDDFDKQKQVTVQSMLKLGTINQKMADHFMSMSPTEFKTTVKASEYWDKKLKSTAETKRIEAQTKMYEGKAATEEAGGAAAVAYQNIVDQYGEDSPQAKAALNKMSGRGSAGGGAIEPTMTPDAIDMAASRLLKGDKTALQNIGRGAQGAANITAINNRVATMAKESGSSAQDILRAQSDLASTNKGLQTLAARSAKIDAAAIEVDKFADNALKSLDKVSRGDIVPINSILQKVSLGSGSPEEAEFATYVQSLVGAYATVIGRGSPTVHSQEEAAKIIRKDYSKPQFAAMVKALQTEARSVQESSVEAGKNIKKETFGSSETDMRKKAQGDMGADPKALDREIDATKADLAKVSDPTSKQELSDHLQDLNRQKQAISPQSNKKEPAAKNAKGWILHKDAKGNRAYVGPNNEIEEVL